MATINAPSLPNVQYSGQYPSAHAHGYINLAAAAIADKVRLVKLFAGTKIYSARQIIGGSLGASTTVSLGFEYVDGQAGGSATALIPATATTAAGSTSSVVAPITLLFDAYITATIGGAAASGQYDAVLTYDPIGTL